jgi:acyl-homoserine lactone acylase PvdQ
VEILLLKDDNDFWIDDINIEKIESKKEIIFKSFQEAMDHLYKRYVDNIENWNWDELYFVSLRINWVKLNCLL